MKTVAIIQARMGSTRLPGKIMKTLSNKTILSHVVERVKQSSEINDIVIATTTSKVDDIIVDETKRLGVISFRGSETDVLSRYYYAAKDNNADIVIRITSDCPLIDANIIDEMVKKIKRTKCDYISNTIERTFPRGLDCEVFTYQSLSKSFIEAKKEYQREHVTPYIYENGSKFKIEHYVSTENNSNYRVTLDTIEDYMALKLILEELDTESTYNDLITLLRSNPSISEINNSIAQKELGKK
ncbi:glycosyltransferase family protein [Alkalicella caledoniensis]|uniref:Glycosyltransferase family protein n=1 Tax=Alkalicella caledoniensis TaxID=2731377 RepID=A0A7G9W3Z9_ALKCA|nr:glycosyltransferase family protein [Alkalicella caledoniensis]QNO13411.1 glycosyltransferase family protein [Alkalicella caledoniensis]